VRSEAFAGILVEVAVLTEVGIRTRVGEGIHAESSGSIETGTFSAWYTSRQLA
jgi:hypothetical protein